MDAETLKLRQAPLKEQYRQDPRSAMFVMRSSGQLKIDSPSCLLETPYGDVTAGLHPGCGGDGKEACSANMLLDALVGCAAVTLAAVTRAMRIEVTHAKVSAEGKLDFRGTLGIDKQTPVGFQSIKLILVMKSDADQQQREKLVELTERYCVVFQTLKAAVPIETVCESV